MYHGCRETLERDPQDLEDPQVLQDRQDRDLCVNHSVTFWIKLPDQSLFDWLIFISDICGYGRFRILRFGICAGEKAELWGLLRTSSSSRSTCALCYIFFFYCWRDHLVCLVYQGHQVLLAHLVQLQQAQVWVLGHLAHQDVMAHLASL